MIPRPPHIVMPAQAGIHVFLEKTKKSSSFFEKKEPKKLLLLVAAGKTTSQFQPTGAKVFCAAFFQKSGFFP